MGNGEFDKIGIF